MVSSVTQNSSSRALALAQVVVSGAAALPWDKICGIAAASTTMIGSARVLSTVKSPLVTSGEGPPAQVSEVSVPARPASKPEPSVYKPGCTVADKTLLTQSYLDSLARGNDGFGILRLGRKHLEEGATAADHARHPKLATDLRDIARDLPAVRTTDQAREAGDRLRPVADQAWALGVACGHHNRPMPKRRVV